MPTPTVKLISSQAASDYLLERHGVRHKESYLRKLRTQGRGPLFLMFNGRPYYTAKLLDEYVGSHLSPKPAQSTAEHEAAGTHTIRRNPRMGRAGNVDRRVPRFETQDSAD